jgi:class 3 adenylate cyclase
MQIKSEGAKSGSSRLHEQREDIENIFPVNMAPWNHPEDPQIRAQYIKPPLFRFDFGASLVPWRLRIMLGLHSYDLHSARRLAWDDIGFDKLNRKSVWRKFGQTLHFATLEFADVSLEKGYQMDYAGRSHHYVQLSGLFVAIICALAVGRAIENNYDNLTCSVGDTILTCVMFYQMILAIIRSFLALAFATKGKLTRWFIGNFQLFQTVWACLGLSLCLTMFYYPPLSHCRIAGQEGSTVAILIAIVSVFFRLRFIYLLLVLLFAAALVLSLRWSSASAEIYGVFDILVIIAAAAGSLGAVYFVEVMLRKDFVQSLAVMTESQRSDRLLRNVLPKRIIDSLKRRQDGMMTNTSAIGPGATALFTRTHGADAAASRLVVSNVNGSWFNRASLGTDSAASRFDSRIGTGGMANTAVAEAFDSVTILFADVVGFTKISSRVSPEQLVLLLNELFTVFDNLADANGLEKIKTIGDAFMAAAGLPNPHPLHAHAAARMALQMIDAVSMFCDDLGNPLQIRIGIHSGSCVAGVIGRRKFIYDVWGDCVNTASRMESHGEPMRVHCSQATADKIQLDFELESRGDMEIKGKGKMQTYFIKGEMAHSKYRSVLPCDIGQWRDRFSSTESVRRASFNEMPTDEEDEDDLINEDEVF